MKTIFVCLVFVINVVLYAQSRDPRSKDQANVFWNGTYPLYSLTSDLEIKADSNGDYVFWGTTNESPSPTKYSLRKGGSMTVYKFITYDECVEFCNSVRKSKGLGLLNNSGGNLSSNILKAQDPKEIENYLLKMKESTSTISNTYFNVDKGLNFDENQKKFAEMIQQKKNSLIKIQKLKEDIRKYGAESEINEMKGYYNFGMDNTVYKISKKSFKKAYNEKFYSIIDLVDTPPIWVMSNNHPTLIYKPKGDSHLWSDDHIIKPKTEKKVLKIIGKSNPLEKSEKKSLIEQYTGLNDRYFELEKALIDEQEVNKNLGLNNFRITDLGGFYCGEISNGELNGFGILFNSLGDTVFIGKWSGNFPDLLNGKLFQYQIQKNEVYLSSNSNLFIAYAPNGDTYCGKKTSNNLRNGIGNYIWANGDKFQGDFIKGKLSGLGKYYFTDGQIWEGNWKDDKFSGMGKKISKDGNVVSEGLYEKGQLIKSKATLEREEQDRIAEERRNEETRIANEKKMEAERKANDKNQVSLKNELLDKNKVVDADGNIYNTVRIRDKIWITENLKTKHYNDGQSIQQVEDHRIWAQLNTPAFCDPPSYFGYANDGLLYNHYVVERGNVCPKGFKVPNATVIDSLLNYYDGYDFGYLLGGFWRNNFDKTADFNDVASGKVKELLTLSGFNFLDGATRDYSFDDQDLDKGYSENYEGFWLRDRKTKFDDEKYSSVVQLEWSGYRFSQSVKIEQKDIRSGNYIRCYKEYIPTISDDKIMSVKDKDDNVHKVVRIGNQIWMAEDLKTVPEQTRVVFNNEELEHYSESVFYDNFKSSGPVNYNYFNLTYYVDMDANFKDVCPQNWHLPDQGEWEIMIRNSNLKDLKSTTGWQIYKKPGYNETKRVECSNCKSGSQKYKDNCNVCRGNGFKIINTGKYIPEQITNYNGTNKSGMNIRPYPTYEYGKFDNNYYNSEVYYLVKDHRAKGFTLITFRLKDIEFDKFGPDLYTRAHIRCVKD
jgi:uncharacterized protein (TIGR02145 family)